VHVGRREGVCRDFAVLGYCEAGIDCSKQHVRECPDFAESGECPNKFCKLPHVIRANRARKPTSTPAPVPTVASVLTADDLVPDVATPPLTVQDSQLGDEYISLTFNESEEDEESGDDDDDEDEEEGDSPNSDDDDAAQD